MASTLVDFGTITPNATGNISYAGWPHDEPPNFLYVFAQYWNVPIFSHRVGMIGFVDENGNAKCSSFYSQCNSTGTSDTHYYMKTAGLIVQGDGSLALDSTWVSWNSDGFTINVSSTFGGPLSFVLMRVEESYVGQVDLGTALTDYAVTDPGFEPDMVWLTGKTGAVNSQRASWTHGLGVATAEAQASICHWAEDAQGTSDCGKVYDKTRISNLYFNNSQNAEVTLKSMDASGFTLTVDYYLPASAQPYFYACVKLPAGDVPFVGNFSAPDEGENVITGFGMRPVIVGSLNAGTNTTGHTAGSNYNTGATVGVGQEACHVTNERDGQVTMEGYTRAPQDSGFLSSLTDTSSSWRSNATTDSFDEDGMTFTVTEVTGPLFDYTIWAIGSIDMAASPGPSQEGSLRSASQEGVGIPTQEYGRCG